MGTGAIGLEAKALNTCSPSVFAICVDSAYNGLSGRLYHGSIANAAAFLEAGGILLEMERVLDDIGLPQASTQLRSFSDKGKHAASFKNKEDETEPMENNIAEQRGAQGTFLVHVIYRQHATWQGKVTWVEKNKTQHFRSALELLKLIDSALNENTQTNE